MSPIETARIKLFEFYYGFCPDPFYAGLLWEIACENVQRAAWLPSPPSEQKGE